MCACVCVRVRKELSCNSIYLAVDVSQLRVKWGARTVSARNRLALTACQSAVTNCGEVRVSEDYYVCCYDIRDAPLVPVTWQGSQIAYSQTR